jgi:phosphatidylinositol 4-kinase
MPRTEATPQVQVCSTFVSTFGDQVTRHSIDPIVYSEVRAILVQCCHQYSRVRKVSLRFFNDLIASFPSLLCDGTVVNVLLELVTVLRRACQSEVIDEVRCSA